MNVVQPLKDKRDIARIRKALSDNPRNLLLFTIGINTALRISDILSLKVGDITDDYIVIRESKTGKRNRIKINKAIKQAVKVCVPPYAKDSDFLFPSRNGYKPISRVQAWRILNRASDIAGVSIAFGTHSLRKTFAYHAYQSGVDISLLMRVLNHASQRETLRYIGIESEDIDDVYVDICL